MPKQAMLDTMKEDKMADWLIAHMSASTDMMNKTGMRGDSTTLRKLLSRGRWPRWWARNCQR